MVEINVLVTEDVTTIVAVTDDVEVSVITTAEVVVVVAVADTVAIVVELIVDSMTDVLDTTTVGVVTLRVKICQSNMYYVMNDLCKRSSGLQVITYTA